MTTQVVLLGTGTPRTDPGKSGPSTAISVNGVGYIFDFGPGVGHRISEAHLTGVADLPFSEITKAFLTHHHSDHTIGLPDLFLTSWMFARDATLDVFGPLGTEGMCRAIRSAYALDIAKRTTSEPHTERGHQISGHDVVPGLVYRDERVLVEAFDVPHGEWAPVHGPHPSMGYRVTTPDAVVVISGDTAAHEGMAAAYDGADIIVHEVFSSTGLSERPMEWQAYHRAAHTSGTDLGRAAAQVQPKHLVLTHQLLWGSTEQELLDEVAAVYAGDVIFGTDLTVIEA